MFLYKPGLVLTRAWCNEAIQIEDAIVNYNENFTTSDLKVNALHNQIHAVHKKHTHYNLNMVNKTGDREKDTR